MKLNLEGHNLTRLVEECSEVIKIVCKIDRFGPFDHNPKEGMTNIDALRAEIGDICGALVWMGVPIETDDEELNQLIQNKVLKIKTWSSREVPA